MTAIRIAFGASTVVAWVVLGAWQRAVLLSSRFAAHREHMETCRFCEPPGWFWTTGYDCNRHNGTGQYPLTLSPWFRLLGSIGWPVVVLAAITERLTDRVTHRLAARTEARWLAEQDRREVEKLVRSL
jgi:hypothetical protein